MVRRLVFALVLVACSKREQPQPEPTYENPPAQPPKPEVTGDFKKGDNVGVAAPTSASHADWVKPAKVVPWTKPSRAPSDQEALLNGTWAAKVGNYATRSAYMADRTVYALDAGKDLVKGAVDAIAADNKLASTCIWLELRPDLTGIRRECAVVNGEPSALDQTDYATGKKSDLGTKLEWFIDDKDGNKIKIHFADDMVVPALQGGKLRTLVFRTWVLKIDKKVGDNLFEVVETIPEHDYTLPAKYAYYIAAQSFLDQK